MAENAWQQKEAEQRRRKCSRQTHSREGVAEERGRADEKVAGRVSRGEGKAVFESYDYIRKDSDGGRWRGGGPCKNNLHNFQLFLL